MENLRGVYTLVIYKLNRLVRNTKQLIDLSLYFEERCIDLQIVSMYINTKDAMGKVFFTMMSAFAELETNLISERTKKGLETARLRGRVGGKPSLSESTKEHIRLLYNSQKYTYEEIAKKTGVSTTTVWRTVRSKEEV